jgi:hypothetical protein
MGTALAKLIKKDFMEIGKWALCITRYAELDKLLLLGFAHKYSRRQKNYIACRATQVKMLKPNPC